MDEDSARGAEARRDLEAELQTFKEEFASLGVILGARYDGSPLIITDGSTPPPDHRAQYTPSACPGGRAPHYWIGNKVSLYDQLGPWFTLLRLGSDVRRSVHGRQCPATWGFLSAFVLRNKAYAVYKPPGPHPT